MSTEVNVKQLNEEIKALKSENKKLKVELATAEEVAESYREKLSSVETERETKKPVVKVGKKAFTINYPGINYGGKVYTAADLQNEENAEVVADLIKIGSEALTEVKKGGE
jgi:cell division septum initiation protein DivIVA